MNTKMSQERIDQVKAGLEAGKTYAQIASDIGITRNAVAGTISRHIANRSTLDAEAYAETFVETAEAPCVDTLPQRCDIGIVFPGVDYRFTLAERLAEESVDGEVVYKARIADDTQRLRMTQTLHNAVFHAHGTNAEGDQIVSVVDVDVTIKRLRDPIYRISVKAAASDDVTALRHALSIHREPDPFTALIASLPADGEVVSIAVPWTSDLKSFGDFTIQRYPNRVAFEKIVREDHFLILDYCKEVQQSSSERTTVVVSSSGGDVVLRDVSLDTFRRGRFFGVDIKMQPHRDLYTVIEAYPGVKFGGIADEVLRDAYHAARRSETFIRASGVGVDLDRIFDSARHRGMTIHRTSDELDADFERICGPIIEKQQAQRRQADRL